MSRLSLSESLTLFGIPAFVATTLVVSLILGKVMLYPNLSTFLLLSGIAVGSFWLVRDTFISLQHKNFSLDYIALLAISTGLVTHHYFVSGVIVLMLAGGNTLERYGTLRAKNSLTALADRIPHTVWLWLSETKTEQQAIESVKVGQTILVRKGEVVPLDGELLSPSATLDESSLTGEMYPVERSRTEPVRSGTVNQGQSILITVTRSEADSTYRHIIEMVSQAQEDKSPLIRLADRYSGIFTVITLVLAGGSWFFTGDLTRALAVLVIATPCPLILATPIALMGGVSAAASERIIVKRLAALEVLSRLKVLIFDKTGTITLGEPVVSEIEILDKKIDKSTALSLARALEKHSLHPLAKAIVRAADQAGAPQKVATKVAETLGKGITGQIDGERYTLGKTNTTDGLSIQLTHVTKPLAILHLQDEFKEDTKNVFEKLQMSGYQLSICTGDTAEHAQTFIAKLDSHVELTANCTPEDKLTGIAQYQKQGKVVAMVGDGINDAPALAKADVGLVYSHEEHTAASEAAEVVFLGSDLQLVPRTLAISRHTIKIAKESIFIGIGLSVIGMILASLGYIPPVVGALLQEIIDVSVILNALRASRPPKTPAL